LKEVSAPDPDPACKRVYFGYFSSASMLKKKKILMHYILGACVNQKEEKNVTFLSLA